MSPKPLADVIDALKGGAERLGEFNEWIDADGLETFSEWLLGGKPAAGEPPERVIITPPPKKNAAPTRFGIRTQPLAEVLATMLPGVTVVLDPMTRALRCHCRTCRSVMEFKSVGIRDATALKQELLTQIGVWYSEHGPSCGRVKVVHHATEESK